MKNHFQEAVYNAYEAGTQVLQSIAREVLASAESSNNIGFSDLYTEQEYRK